MAGGGRRERGSHADAKAERHHSRNKQLLHC
jgi:hypothetical protein